LTTSPFIFNFSEKGKKKDVCYDYLTHDIDLEDIEDDEIRDIVAESEEKGEKQHGDVVRFK
jgi:CRISPR/Cas system CMR subunit Cmr4 (Cas7 group RAMP superfamily)